MFKQIYICTTYYHAYVTMAKTLLNRDKPDLMICDDIPKGQELGKRMEDTGCFGSVYFFEQSKAPNIQGKNKLDWIFFQHRRSAKALQEVLPCRLSEYEDIYLFNDVTAIGRYLMDIQKPYHLIEDALDFYQKIHKTIFVSFLPKYTIKYRVQKLLNSGYFPLGEYKRLLDIEVNDKENLKVSSNCVKEVPREELFGSLQNADWEILKKVFLPNFNFHLQKRNYALLLTQPLFEDGIVESREELRQRYKNIVKKMHKKGLNVIIKPHPRDKTDYNKVFTKCIILPKEFPSEALFDILKIEFDEIYWDSPCR